MARRRNDPLLNAFLASLCMIFWGQGTSAEGEYVPLDRMFGFVESGIPDCVDVSGNYVTPDFVEKFRKVLTIETGIPDGGVKVSEERLAVADCGAFYTVTTTYPVSENDRKLHLGETYVFFFVNNLFLETRFPEGDFSNYVFLLM